MTACSLVRYDPKTPVILPSERRMRTKDMFQDEGNIYMGKERLVDIFGLGNRNEAMSCCDCNPHGYLCSLANIGAVG